MKKTLLTVWLIGSVLSSVSGIAQTQHDLIGTWIGISHQTITVTHFRKDNTFSGTYFTPAFDVKTTFSGKWKLEDNILVFNYLESSSPVMPVPFVDKNRLVIKDRDTVVFHTYPSGISLEYNRVLFKNRSEIYLKENKAGSNKAPDAAHDKPSRYTDRDNDTRLIRGALTGDADLVRRALDEGADINVHEKEKGNTALILAAFFNHHDIVDALVSSGADVNARCKEENTALIKAAWNGSTESARRLIRAGADIDAKEIAGMTALMIASFYGHIDVVKLLVAADCQINGQDKDGVTALSNAKSQGHTEIADYLIKHNAN